MHPTSASSVAFNVKFLGPLPYASLPVDGSRAVDMLNDAYEARLDLSSNSSKNRYAFLLYVNRSDAFQKSVFQYEVSEDPTGPFNDTLANVTFRIGSGPSATLGTALVPIHSPFGYAHALVYNPPAGDHDSVKSIPIGGETSFTVTLDSTIDQLGAALGEPSATISCDKCLQLPIAVKLSKQTLIPSDHVDVKVVLDPVTIAAMKASAHPDSEKFDADLILSIPLTADGGSPATQSIPIHIRFSPPIAGIVLGVLFGMLLGAALRMWLSTTRKDHHEFFIGLAYAAVCWLLAFFLFSNTNGGTVIKLWGVTLNPTQIFSAFMLCFLAAGGSPLMGFIKDSVFKSFFGGKS